MSELTYSDALTELENIVKEIENETPDPDTLMMRVKRAAELILFCRKRLLNSETEINNVLSKLTGNADEESEND